MARCLHTPARARTGDLANAAVRRSPCASSPVGTDCLHFPRAQSSLQGDALGKTPECHPPLRVVGFFATLGEQKCRLKLALCTCEVFPELMASDGEQSPVRRPSHPPSPPGLVQRLRPVSAGRQRYLGRRRARLRSGVFTGYPQKIARPLAPAGLGVSPLTGREKLSPLPPRLVFPPLPVPFTPSRFGLRGGLVPFPRFLAARRLLRAAPGARAGLRFRRRPARILPGAAVSVTPDHTRQALHRRRCPGDVSSPRQP